ncbi:hypothetical protein BGZ59_007955 [Podila verticillata]|nr:hypothetical protein BGZ59_007955 [Podila verticillata]
MDSYSARTLTATLVILASAAVIVHAWSTAGAEQPSSGSRSRKSKNRASKNADKEPQYVTGLVNIGNTCFMNSVLQALASLPSLQAYLRGRKELGHDSDSITLALCETVERQSTSSVMSASLSSISSLSLSSPSSATNRSKSISSNTGQLSPKSPSPRSTQEGKENASNGFMTASLIVDKKEQEKYNRAKSPFMGLLASRVSCVDCGYTRLQLPEVYSSEFQS